MARLCQVLLSSFLLLSSVSALAEEPCGTDNNPCEEVEVEVILYFDTANANDPGGASDTQDTADSGGTTFGVADELLGEYEVSKPQLEAEEPEWYNTRWGKYFRRELIALSIALIIFWLVFVVWWRSSFAKK